MAETTPAAPQRRQVSADEFVGHIKANQDLIDFSNCDIIGDVDLRSVEFSHPLVIRNTIFRGYFDASDAHFARRVDLSGSYFALGISLNGTRIDGELLLMGTGFLAPENEFMWARLSGLHVAGNLNISGARFQGDLDLRNATIDGDVLGDYYQNDVLRITRHANFSGARIGGKLLCYNMQVNGQMNMQGTIIKNGMFCRSAPGQPALYIGGALFLSSALIEVECDISGSILEGGINFHDTVVNGNIVCATLDRFPMKVGNEKLQTAAYMPGVKVTGRIDMSNADILGDLNLNACRITGRLELKGTLVYGNVNLKSAQIEGGVFATPLMPNEPPEESTAPQTPPATTDATEGAAPAPPAPATPPAPASPPAAPKPKEARPARFAGEFRMDNAKVRVSVEMGGARFLGGLFIFDAHIEGTLRLDCDVKECRTIVGYETKREDKTEVVGGKLSLAGTQVTAITQLNGLVVLGDLDMAGTILKGGLIGGLDREGRALFIGRNANFPSVQIGVAAEFFAVQVIGNFDARDGIIEGNLELSSRVGLRSSIKGSLVLTGTRIAGSLGLRGLSIEQDCDMRGAKIERGITARSFEDKPFAVGGHVFMNSIRVGVNLELLGAQIKGSLLLTNAVIEGNLDASMLEKDQPTSIGSNVDLSGAMVKARTLFDGALLGRDLLASQAELLGGLSLASLPGNRVMVSGKVFLPSLKAGRVLLHGTKIAQHLDLRDAEISGTLSLLMVREKDHDYAVEVDGVSCTGAKISKAEFRGVSIRGDLDFQNAEITDRVEVLPDQQRDSEILGNALFIDCRSARLEIDGNTIQKSLQLNLAKIGELKFLHALPRQGVPIDADGLEYQKIELPNNDYNGFLKRLQPFQKSSYVFLENWLRNRGQENLAKKVFIAMNWRSICTQPKPVTTKNPIYGYFKRLTNWSFWLCQWLAGMLLWLTIGFGVYSHRLLGIWLLLITLSAGIFADPASVRPISARVPAVLPTDEDGGRGKAGGNARTSAGGVPSDPRDWESRDAWIMAVQMNLPMVPLVTGEERKPSSNEFRFPIIGNTMTYETYAFYISLLSYVLVPLFIAGVTGFLKKQK